MHAIPHKNDYNHTILGRQDRLTLPKDLDASRLKVDYRLSGNAILWLAYTDTIEFNLQGSFAGDEGTRIVKMYSEVKTLERGTANL